MKKFLFILLLFSAKGNALFSQVKSYEKAFVLTLSGYYTPSERINLKATNFTHKSNLYTSRSFGFQIELGQKMALSNAYNWSYSYGVLYGFYPHATRLHIPVDENLVNWETNSIILDHDEYFGLSFRFLRKISLKNRIELIPAIHLLTIKQIKLGFNNESIEAIDNNYQSYSLYEASIKTPPNKGFSFLPQISLGIEKYLLKNLSFSVSIFQNYGNRLSHSGQFIINTNKGSIEGDFTKKFYFGGLQIGLVYHK